MNFGYIVEKSTPDTCTELFFGFFTLNQTYLSLKKLRKSALVQGEENKKKNALYKC